MELEDGSSSSEMREFISNSFDLDLIDNIVYVADRRNIIFGVEDWDIGANLSAEKGGDESVEDMCSLCSDRNYRRTDLTYTRFRYYDSDAAPSLPCTPSRFAHLLPPRLPSLSRYVRKLPWQNVREDAWLIP